MPTPNFESKNPFEILGLERNPTIEDVKKAYRGLALVYHTDKGGEIEKFQKIQGAYEKAKKLIESNTFKQNTAYSKSNCSNKYNDICDKIILLTKSYYKDNMKEKNILNEVISLLQQLENSNFRKCVEILLNLERGNLSSDEFINQVSILILNLPLDHANYPKVYQPNLNLSLYEKEIHLLISKKIFEISKTSESASICKSILLGIYCLENYLVQNLTQTSADQIIKIYTSIYDKPLSGILSWEFSQLYSTIEERFDQSKNLLFYIYKEVIVKDIKYGLLSDNESLCNRALKIHPNDSTLKEKLADILYNRSNINRKRNSREIKQARDQLLKPIEIFKSILEDNIDLNIKLANCYYLYATLELDSNYKNKNECFKKALNHLSVFLKNSLNRLDSKRIEELKKTESEWQKEYNTYLELHDKKKQNQKQQNLKTNEVLGLKQNQKGTNFTAEEPSKDQTISRLTEENLNKDQIIAAQAQTIAKLEATLAKYEAERISAQKRPLDEFQTNWQSKFQKTDQNTEFYSR